MAWGLSQAILKVTSVGKWHLTKHAEGYLEGNIMQHAKKKSQKLEEQRRINYIFYWDSCYALELYLFSLMFDLLVWPIFKTVCTIKISIWWKKLLKIGRYMVNKLFYFFVEYFRKNSKVWKFIQNFMDVQLESYGKVWKVL